MFNYEPELIMAIIAKESSFNNKASTKFAFGLSQQTFYGAFPYYFKGKIKHPICLPTFYSDIKRDFPDILSVYAMIITFENKKLENIELKSNFSYEKLLQIYNGKNKQNDDYVKDILKYYYLLKQK